jgi:hypothetical protein
MVLYYPIFLPSSNGVDMARRPVYEPNHVVIWEYNGRRGKGRDSVTHITEAMKNQAVTKSVVPIVQQWRSNLRSSRELAASLYKWYRTHAIPYPGVVILHYDLHIVDRTTGERVVSIDVSSGGVLYLCKLP